MNKIDNLEQKWKIYKTKKIVSSLLLLLIVYVVGAGVYYSYLKRDSINNFFSKETVVQNELNVTTVEEQNISDIKSIVKKEESVEMKVEELFFQPIIPIIDMEKERVRTPKSVIHKEKIPSHRIRAKPSTYLTAQELSKIKVSNHEERDTTRLKRIHLGSSSKNYIETMKKKFLKSKNSRDALLLAKAFYREKNYKESEKWALEANKIDSDLDESWILFAQAKAKMGKKNEAIKILIIYYKRTKSPNVKAMIEKIKIGDI